MAEIRQVGSLQINEDADFQRKEWRWERIGWALLALVLLAAVAGLLGPGPLSSATAGEEGGALWVNYDRFAHRSAPTTLEVHVGPDTAREGSLRLWIDRATVGVNMVRSIQPEPELVSADGEHIVYSFAVDDPTRETVIYFHLEPLRYVRQRVALGIEGGSQVGFLQMLYP